MNDWLEKKKPGYFHYWLSNGYRHYIATIYMGSVA